jgi:hypothetical protein
MMDQHQRRYTAWAAVWIALFAVALVFLATGCGPVEDGGKGKTKVTGGRIQNHPDSVQRINAYHSWGAQGPAGKPTSLKPGAATSSKKDADGFCTLDYPAEVTTITIFIGTTTSKSTLGAGECRKVSDNQSVIVKVVKRLEGVRS